MADGGVQGEPSARQERSAGVSRITVALIATWTALVAIPGALPWASNDDAARALAAGVAISSIIAVVGLAVAFVRADSLGDDGARFGTAAACIAVVLAGLEVVEPDASPRRLKVSPDRDWNRTPPVAGRNPYCHKRINYCHKRINKPLLRRVQVLEPPHSPASSPESCS